MATTKGYFEENLLAVCNLLEARVAHELNLINHRVSWLATSQSFLMLAMVTLLSGSPRPIHAGLAWFAVFIPIVGIILCTLVLFGVRAALKELRGLLAERVAVTRSVNTLAGTAVPEQGPDRLTAFFGAVPAQLIPITFIVTWVVAAVLGVWVIWRP
jgi:hypothetical protein